MQKPGNALNPAPDVLWVGKNLKNFNGFTSWVETSGLQINLKKEKQLAEKWAGFSIINIEDEEELSSLLECEADPFSIRLLLVEKLSETSVINLVNSGRVDSFHFSLTSLQDAFPSFFQKYLDLKDKESIRRRITSQNIQLEDLAKNLEEIVEARSAAFVDKSQKAKENLKEVQKILKLIKEISGAESFDEILVELRSAIKTFHGVMPPLLIQKESVQNYKILYFRGKQVLEKKIASSELDSYLKNQSHKTIEDLRQYLSNIFSKPMGPIKCFYPKEDVGQSLNSLNSIVVFEHSLSMEGKSKFDDFISKRLSLVFTAIENLALRESSRTLARQWSTTFSAIPDPILIVSKNLKVQLANNLSKKGHCYSILFGRDEPCRNCPIVEDSEGPSESSFHINHENKIFRVNSYPIDPAGGESRFYVNEYLDVTAQTALQGQVIQGEKVAAIGMLAGNVAHELNNPLTGISSLSELLLDEVPAESSVHSDLIEVREAAIRCQGIIKNLLDFSNLDLSENKIIEINKIVENTLPFLKTVLREHKVEILLSEKPLFFKAQSQLIQQVIFNLVNNGCQAMEEGGKIKVETKLKDEKIQLTVTDTGPGIPKSIQDSIFQPFFTTKEKGMGTGLGLSMSRQIIESIGGKLTLPFSNAKGTQFLVELPLSREEVL